MLLMLQLASASYVPSPPAFTLMPSAQLMLTLHHLHAGHAPDAAHHCQMPVSCLMVAAVRCCRKPTIAVSPTEEDENELNPTGQLGTNGVQSTGPANPQHITSATMNQGKNAKPLVTTSSTPSLASTTTSSAAAAGAIGKATTKSATSLVQQQAPGLQGTFTGVSSGGGNTPAVPATPAQPAATAGHSLGGTFKTVSSSGRRLRGVAAIQD